MATLYVRVVALNGDLMQGIGNSHRALGVLGTVDGEEEEALPLLEHACAQLDEWARTVPYEVSFVFTGDMKFMVGAAGLPGATSSRHPCLWCRQCDHGPSWTAPGEITTTVAELDRYARRRAAVGPYRRPPGKAATPEQQVEYDTWLGVCEREGVNGAFYPAGHTQAGKYYTNQGMFEEWEMEGVKGQVRAPVVRLCGPPEQPVWRWLIDALHARVQLVNAAVKWVYTICESITSETVQLAARGGGEDGQACQQAEAGGARAAAPMRGRVPPRDGPERRHGVARARDRPTLARAAPRSPVPRSGR